MIAFALLRRVFQAPTKVRVVKFEVTPRQNSPQTEDRYAGVRLIADSKTVAITPNPNSARTAFDMLDYDNGEPAIGKVFRLDWTKSPDGHPAQVEFIEIDYQKVLAPTGKSEGRP